MKRDFYEQLQKHIEDKSSSEVLILEGARQVGKTYLLKSVLKTVSRPVHFFDLEKDFKLRNKILESEDFNDFKIMLQDQYGVKNGHILALDEAQESKKLATYVKSIKEDWPEVKVILTGSSMNRLFDKNIRIPVGRYKTLFLQGFSFSEFIRHTKDDELAEFINSAPVSIPKSRHTLLLNYFNDYLQVGGYPEAVKAFSKGENYHNIILQNYLSLTEDFERKEEYSPELFDKILTSTANNLGSPAKLTQVNEKKYLTQKALAAIKSWHLIHEVECSSFDPKHSTFLPKRYLFDVGLASLKRTFATPQISIIDTVDSAMRIPLGGIIENAVLLALIDNNSLLIPGTWKKRSSSDIEVDFVATAQQARIPIECKASLKLKKSFSKNIIHYLNGSGQKSGALVSLAPFERIQNDKGYNIINIPAYLMSKENLNTYLFM